MIFLLLNPVVKPQINIEISDNYFDTRIICDDEMSNLNGLKILKLKSKQKLIVKL